MKLSKLKLEPKLGLTQKCLQILTAALALLGLNLLSVDACAKPHSIVWVLSYDETLAPKNRDQAKSVLLRILARAEEKHYATDEALKSKLASEGFQLPPCFFDGTTCTSAPSLALDIYNVDAIARAKFGKSGQTWTLNIDLEQRYTTEPKHITYESEQLDELVRQTLGELFSLESTFDVQSLPAGAKLFLNDTLVGETPISLKVQAGTQHVVIKKNGYKDFETTLQAQKGMAHAVDACLELLPTQLTVLTSDPEAEIWIDGEIAGHSHEALEVLPGKHEIEVQSEYYANISQTVTLYSLEPNTIQLALRPNPVDIYTVRDRGLRKYNHSVFLGYHFDYSHNVALKPLQLNYTWYHPSEGKFNYNLHGVEFGFTNEMGKIDWDPLRITLAGNNPDLFYKPMTEQPAESMGIFEFAIYPLSGRYHHLFQNIPVQIDVALGAGYTYFKLSGSHKIQIQQHALSLAATLGARYFFSEEFYLALGYRLGTNIIFNKNSSANASLSHNIYLNFGYNIPLHMNDPLPLYYNIDENINIEEDSETFENVDLMTIEEEVF